MVLCAHEWPAEFCSLPWEWPVAVKAIMAKSVTKKSCERIHKSTLVEMWTVRVFLSSQSSCGLGLEPTKKEEIKAAFLRVLAGEKNVDDFFSQDSTSHLSHVRSDTRTRTTRRSYHLKANLKIINTAIRISPSNAK